MNQQTVLKTTKYIAIGLIGILWLWTTIGWSMECSFEPFNAIVAIILPTAIELLRENNSKRIQRLVRIIFIAILLLAGFWLVLNFTICAKTPPPSVAIEFLLDSSDNMTTEINGIARYEIARNSIQEIGNLPGIETSQVWRSLRLSGGGNECNQSRQVSHGALIRTEDLLAPLTNYQFGGTNAYELGLDGVAEDFAALGNELDVKIAILFLGSIDSSPCRDFDWVTRLRILRQMGIDATLCVFALDIELPAYENFKAQLSQEGFGCVHNVSNPQDISDIAVGVIENLLLVEEGEVEILITETPVIYIASETLAPIVTPSETATASPTVTPSEETEIAVVPTLTEEITLESLSPSETIESLTETATRASNPEIENLNAATVMVNVASANLRTGPGTNYLVASTAQNGEVFAVIAKTGSGDSLWYLINDSGDEVWIAASIVILNGDEATIEIAATIPPTPQTISSSNTNSVSSNQHPQWGTSQQISPPYSYSGTIAWPTMESYPQQHWYYFTVDTEVSVIANLNTNDSQGEHCVVAGRFHALDTNWYLHFSDSNTAYPLNFSLEVGQTYELWLQVTGLQGEFEPLETCITNYTLTISR